MDVLILVGGQSRRMGQSKPLLAYRGRRLVDYLLDVVRAAGGTAHLVGKADSPLAREYAERWISDEVDAGPLGGLAAGLARVDGDRAVVLACDLPRVTPETLTWLWRLSETHPSYDAWVSCDGMRVHPLLAVYRTRVLPRVRAQLATGSYALSGLLNRLAWFAAPLPDPAWAANANTPEEWMALTGEWPALHGASPISTVPARLDGTAAAAPLVFQLVGFAKRGKTTWAKAIVAHFASRGWRVGSLKHDGGGHGLAWEVDGRDSREHARAGAARAVVVSGGEKGIYERRDAPWELDELLADFSGCDLIVVEGFKNAPFPKWVFVRDPEDWILAERLTGVVGAVAHPRARVAAPPQVPWPVWDIDRPDDALTWLEHWLRRHRLAPRR
ncbi:MAG: molybdopterin-guanine dinucleotide biosynthesis protein B [Calditerricola sp.]|nr:molybdopterin-guanine dinucleotide biosynthesis protein B [Calditerricola sp.]